MTRDRMRAAMEANARAMARTGPCQCRDCLRDRARQLEERMRDKRIRETLYVGKSGPTNDLTALPLRVRLLARMRGEFWSWESPTLVGLAEAFCLVAAVVGVVMLFKACVGFWG